MTSLAYTVEDLKRRVTALEREKHEMQSEITSQKNNLELMGMMLMFAASIAVIVLAAR